MTYPDDRDVTIAKLYARLAALQAQVAEYTEAMERASAEIERLHAELRDVGPTP